MFAYSGIVLFGLHLFRMQPLVLGGCVEVTGTGTGDESDFFAHCFVLQSLNAFAVSAHVGEHLVDAELVDNSHAVV
jgi:hypothetical protein